MRMIAIAAIALFAAFSPALADEAEGEVRSIDAEQLTITLTDGKSYKLPGEFDITAISEGMTILLAFEEVDGQNLITDMQISE